MTNLTYLTLFLIAGALAIYLYKRNSRRNEPLPMNNLRPSAFKWSILIKLNGKVYLESEDNDLGKIGFHIYTNLVQSIDSHSIYIRDNSSNELMRIDKDYESESMIGVNHPEQGHIGYLPFTIVDSIR